MNHKCHKCNEEKPAEEFYKDRSKKSGLQSRCKKCDHAMKRSNGRKSYQTYNFNRRSASGNRITIEQWSLIRKVFDYVCVCCEGSKYKVSPDHIVPVAKGGSNSASNCQPLCNTCNQAKGDLIIDFRDGTKSRKDIAEIKPEPILF